jgi:hypothetical protein
VVGAYAWRGFENTKARPLAIVRRRFEFAAHDIAADGNSAPAPLPSAREAARMEIYK